MPTVDPIYLRFRLSQGPLLYIQSARSPNARRNEADLHRMLAEIEVVTKEGSGNGEPRVLTKVSDSSSTLAGAHRCAAGDAHILHRNA